MRFISFQEVLDAEKERKRQADNRRKVTKPEIPAAKLTRRQAAALLQERETAEDSSVDPHESPDDAAQDEHELLHAATQE